MDGEFFIDTVNTKPPWTEAYIGRFIYDESANVYFLGGLTKWIALGYGQNSVDEYSINFGMGYRQVNAGSIPFSHPFIIGNDVYESIVSIASGVGLFDGSFKTRHFASDQIKGEHLNWSISPEGVNASHMPVNSLYVDSSTAEILSVEEAIQQLELGTVKLSRLTVQSTAWTFAPSENLYRTTIVTLPMTESPVLIQCYSEDTGRLITPNIIENDSGTNRIHIWYTESIAINIIMVG